jgi:glycosyltransferase involved in cell wall biosynthesis
VEDYLNCADAFMLSSVYEGNPMSILEAFACGVVPVCTAVGGIVDTVKEGVSGYLAEKVEVESLYAAVMRYLNDPEKIKPETLKQLFQDNYTMEKCAEKYVTLFRRGS